MLTNHAINFRNAMIIAVAALFAGCDKEQSKTDQPVTATSEASLNALISENGANPDEAMLSDERAISQTGYIYTESNDATQNEIFIYKQEADGSLTWIDKVASGGKGLGAGLGSQGAVVLDAWHKRLYAVNAGDNSVSSFWVHDDGKLSLAYTINSGGTMPISVTTSNDLLYVVNSSNICGFKIGQDASLMKIDGSDQALSSSNAAPAQISFNATGKVLYVTEKMTNMIASYVLKADGAAMPGKFMNSVGATPFGFDFSGYQDFLIVSNAAGGAANEGSCTAYSTNAMGNINSINGAVSNYQSAPCWVAATKHGRFAFVTNTGSDNISTYYVSPLGSLHLVFFNVAKSGDAPTEIVVSGNNNYVYAINSIDHTISQYKRGFLGKLIPNGTLSNIPSYAVGIAAY